MKLPRLLPVLVTLAAFVAAGGCGGGDEGGQAPQPGASGDAAVPYDRAFIDAMVPHHREAIAMTRAANARGLTQPDLEKIARDIIASQQQEIDQMLSWRESWFGSRELGRVLPEVLGVPESQLGMGHGGADAISGAVDVDQEFARMMLPHHEGAVAMAEVAGKRGRHQEIKELAGAIVEAQSSEIEVLERHASGEHHG